VSPPGRANEIPFDHLPEHPPNLEKAASPLSPHRKLTALATMIGQPSPPPVLDAGHATDISRTSTSGALPLVWALCSGICSHRLCVSPA